LHQGTAVVYQADDVCYQHHVSNCSKHASALAAVSKQNDTQFCQQPLLRSKGVASYAALAYLYEASTLEEELLVKTQVNFFFNLMNTE
jgi:hypothetical protein